jgi:iron(III) transport system ATP-binding protein
MKMTHDKHRASTTDVRSPAEATGQAGFASTTLSGRETRHTIEVRGIQKIFQRKTGSIVAAVADLTLEVNEGEMVAVVGPSGCGKTTLLRCIAGLEMPTAGSIVIDGVEVSNAATGVFVPPEKRGIGMMFQSYALWPHLTIGENVAYPLRRRGMRKQDIWPLVDSMLAKVGLPDLRDESPGRLSGGQQQRVALVRSLVASPSVVLFDEPLSNVDAKVRDQLRVELVRMQREIGFSGLYVTHDQEDAMQVCDRLIVLKAGKVEQSGVPMDVFNAPNSVYVAEFVGVVNQIRGAVTAGAANDAFVTVRTDIGDIEVPTHQVIIGDKTDVCVLIRPQGFAISNRAPGAKHNQWTATIGAKMFRGTRFQYLVSVGEQQLRVWSEDDSFEEGQTVYISAPDQAIIVRPYEPGTQE